MTVAQHETELAALLALVGSHDEVAFRKLYEMTTSRLFGLALFIVRDRSAAEDVLQEAFISIWHGAGNYHNALSSPLTWLGMVVRSRSIEHLRRRVTDRSAVSQDLEGSAAEHLAAEDTDASYYLDLSKQAAALDLCLRELQVSQRQAIMLAYLQELTHSELADHLKVPIGTVKTWIRRGLMSLRLCMQV